MGLLAKIERKLGWLAFPGFLRFYAMLQALTYVLQFFSPEMGQLMGFDRAKIFEGEYWRVVTFLFASSASGGSSFGLLFMFFMVMIAFMISDALEAAWGTFSASLFYYTGILCMVGVNFLVGVSLPGSGMLLYSSAFFAFATLFPKVEFTLFFILPIQVRFLAIIGGVLLLLTAVSIPVLFPLYVLALLNYILWAGIPALRGTARNIGAAQRRQKHNEKQLPASEAFHTCAVCKRTEHDAPGLEFRVGTDGEEYCTEHLPKLKE